MIVGVQTRSRHAYGRLNLRKRRRITAGDTLLRARPGHPEQFSQAVVSLVMCSISAGDLTKLLPALSAFLGFMRPTYFLPPPFFCLSQVSLHGVEEPERHRKDNAQLREISAGQGRRAGAAIPAQARSDGLRGRRAGDVSSGQSVLLGMCILCTVAPLVARHGRVRGPFAGWWASQVPPGRSVCRR